MRPKPSCLNERGGVQWCNIYAAPTSTSPPFESRASMQDAGSRPLPLHQSPDAHLQIRRRAAGLTPGRPQVTLKGLLCSHRLGFGVIWNVMRGRTVEETDPSLPMFILIFRYQARLAICLALRCHHYFTSMNKLVATSCSGMLSTTEIDLLSDTMW